MRRQIEFENSQQISIGRLIKLIEDAGTKSPTTGKDKGVRFDFCYCFPTSIDSYRGYYDELAIGFKIAGYEGNSEVATSADEFLKLLKGAIGNTFTGWKGGDFMMTEDTPIWVDNPGNASSTAVMGIEDDGYQIVIRTFYRKD